MTFRTIGKGKIGIQEGPSTPIRPLFATPDWLEGAIERAAADVCSLTLKPLENRERVVYGLIEKHIAQAWREHGRL